MKTYSILVKIDNPVAEAVITDTLTAYIARQGGEVLGITKEGESVFCFEFSILTIKAQDREAEKNILSLLQYIVVGL
jgi:hypothetical protein